MRKAIMFGRFLALVSTLAGCSQKHPESNLVPLIKSDAEHNHYYKEANDLVSPFLKLANGVEKPANTRKAEADLRRGIALYQAVVAYASNNWSAYWLMGKAHQALGEHEAACDAFGKAFTLQQQNPDVAREYMLECLDLGRTSDAVSAGEHALSLKPQDAGLLANLALAYTLTGRNSEAWSTVNASLAISPKDPITLSLKRMIGEVTAGKRPQPKTMSDLETR